MFEFVARHKRLMQLVLALFIVPPFAFWGIDFYQRGMISGNDLAKVGGQDITEQEFNEQLRQQQERMRALLGTNFNSAVLESPELRAGLLEGMISQRLLIQYAIRSNLTVTDDQLREVIASIPAFQDNGKFSRQRYEEAVARQGYTPAFFESTLRRDLLVQQVTSALSDSGMVSKSTSMQLAALRLEKREIAEYLLGVDQFSSPVKVSPESVQAYYEGNRPQFQVPEQVRLEYAVLTSDALQALTQVSADEVKQWYQSHLGQFGEMEQRQASHILVSVKAGANDADRAKARAKAEGLLAQLRKNPAQFAELARKNSDDPGSAAKGGDVGYFGRGMMVKSFEDAVFQLKPNEVSGIVDSEFGFHIIKLTGIKPGKVRTLEEARPDIERELKKQQAGRRFAEVAEAFSNIVYEQPDSLKPAADKFGLSIQSSGWVTRQSAPVPLLNNPRVLAAVFSEDAIKNHRNIEAVEVAPGTLLSARVVEHKPTSTKPLDEVRAEIMKELARKEAAGMAYKLGAQQLDRLKKGETGAVNFGPGRLVGRDDTKALRAEALKAVFRADRSRLPAYSGVELPNGYLILRISRVVDAEVDESQRRNLQAELGRLAGASEFQAFVAGLRAGANVMINKAALEKKPQQ